jgi:hypothetical protein
MGLNIRYDMRKMVLVEYAHDYDFDPAKNNDNQLLGNWRHHILDLAHMIPAIMLILEFLMNKIRIPWTHVLYTIITTFSYFVFTYIGQVLNDDVAVYIQSLNWNCDKNKSFLIVETPGAANKRVFSNRGKFIGSKTCEPYYNDGGLGTDTICYNMYNSIYVESASIGSPLNDLKSLIPKTGYKCEAGAINEHEIYENIPQWD